MSQYPLSYPEFKRIYSKVPRLTVELIIKSDKGILLTKRAIDPYIGTWHIPGGTVYYKETLEDAVHRVARDELGISVNIIECLGFIYYETMIKDTGWGWPIGTAFSISIKSGTPRGSEQAEEVGFFKVLPEYVAPSQAEFLLSKGLIREHD